MTSTDLILTMARNNAWANARIYDTIAGMDDEAFAAPRPGFFGSLKVTLNHIRKADLFYLDTLEDGGQGRSVLFTDDIDSADTLASAQAETDQRLITFCATLTPEMLTERRRTERRDCFVTEQIGPMLLHLLQHQIHHRGQAHTMIMDAGFAPPQLDEFHIDFERHPDAVRYDA